uniref:Pentatricopeptide repeat protein n=1 Tax=Salvia miltiorrhiza TaxID=226208 RepID=A0A678WE12_SALMI|nr:pentatricopeptide repeat protein [Salvia miltiorrhiza]
MEEYKTALYMFDEMRQLDAPIDLCTMNIAINFYCLLKRVNFGFAMLGCIFKLGYEPNAVTFTTLVKGLCLNDKVIEAENLFLNLLGHNLSVTDEVMISTLINGLCKGGWTSRACDLLEFLERTSCKPNAYSALMDGYCSQGRIDKVKGIFRSIVEQGLEPNMFTYAILIKGCFKKGKVDEAWCIFHKVSRKGLQHTTVTYNTMLHGLVCAGRFSEGWKLFGDMEAQQVRPDIITYGILVKGLCADGRVAAARDLLHQLPSKGLRPDVRMYTTIIASLHRKGLIEEGKRLLKEMKENGLRRDETLERLIRERDEL